MTYQRDLLLRAMLVVSAGDGSASATRTIELVVRNVNQAPRLLPVPLQLVQEGQTLAFTMLAGDADNDPTRLAFIYDDDTPAAGIVTGVMLAVARVIGETAPLLIAAGFTQSLNNNPLSGPMMTLPVFVYRSYIDQGNPASAYLDRAWAGALTLILIVMVLNLAGRLVAAKFAPKAGR